MIHSTGGLSVTFTGYPDNSIYTAGDEIFTVIYTATSFELQALTSVPELAT